MLCYFLGFGRLLCYLIGVRPLAMLPNVPQLKINSKSIQKQFNQSVPHPARVGRNATQQRRAEMPPSKGGQKCHPARVVPVWLQSRLALSVCLSVCLSVGCLLCYLIGVWLLAMLSNWASAAWKSAVSASSVSETRSTVPRNLHLVSQRPVPQCHVISNHHLRMHFAERTSVPPTGPWLSSPRL